MASTDAMPVPKKGVAYRHYFALRNTDGTLCTSWDGEDTELSKDGGAFADATNEATEIGTSGCGYVDLTAAETDYDAIIVKVTVTNTDSLPYVVTLFPEEAGDIRANVTQISGSGDAADNAEIVFDTDFATNYDTDNDKWQTEADVTAWKGTAPAALTDTDKVQVSVQHMADSVIAAASIAGDAITSAKIADDAIGDEHWNVTAVDADLTDAAKLAIQQIAAGGIR